MFIKGKVTQVTFQVHDTFIKNKSYLNPLHLKDLMNPHDDVLYHAQLAHNDSL